jgi:hypothetical protein
MNKLLPRCPVCCGPVHVTELGCETCGTHVHSDFEACRFCSLTQEQLQFVELFLRHRGNITSVGEALGISHPTVTRRLEAVIASLNGAPVLAQPPLTQLPPAQTAPVAEALHYPPTPPPPFVPSAPSPPPAAPDHRDAERDRILEMLDRGEISADEATRRLNDL